MNLFYFIYSLKQKQNKRKKWQREKTRDIVTILILTALMIPMCSSHVYYIEAWMLSFEESQNYCCLDFN